LTTWFLIVSLASVGLTTWLTNAAVYRAELELAKAFPEVVGLELSPWDRPQILVNDPRYRAANEAFRNVTRTALFAGIGAFILSGIAAAVVTRRLTRPLLALEAAAGRLERGEPGVKLALPESKDELRTVTEAFNRLTEGLERQQAWRKRVVADIAHDLRTPLSVMRSEIEAMQDGVRPLDHASLERLLGEIALIARMVEDLRVLERAEGSLTLTVKPLELGAWLREVTDSFRVRAEREGFGVHVEPMAGEITVRADEMQLTRVLNNILQNAVEHSGGTRATVSASTQGAQVLVRVRDNGRGISDPARIFERFYRGDESRTRDPDGRAHSGLGLSIARAIAEAHGGSLTASSDPGGGATFELRLPTA
jgi:two-component system sensor histidine kinase BaeS